MLACSTAEATQDTNIWPSWDNPRLFLEQLRICHTGLVERYTVCGLSTTNVLEPNTNRPNKVTLEAYKVNLKTLLPYFWNATQPISNAQAVAYWNEKDFLEYKGWPTNALDWTPDRGMSGTGGYTNDTTVGHGYGFTNEYTVVGGTNFPGSRTNWYTTDYGVQVVRDGLSVCKYTTVNAGITNADYTDYSDVGIVYFLLEYTNFPAQNYGEDQTRLEDWEEDSSTNVHYGGAPVVWPGLLLSQATEPNDAMITSQSWAGVNIDYFDLFSTKTNRGRTGNWDYNYLVTTSGTNVVAGSDLYYNLGFSSFPQFDGIEWSFTSPILWTNLVNSFTFTSSGETGDKDYLIASFGKDSTNTWADRDATGNIIFDSATYVGAKISDNKAYTYIYSSTNAGGATISTNYNSGRQLYMYGDYPSVFLSYNGSANPQVMTSLFTWEADTAASASLILTNWSPVGTEFVTNSAIEVNDTFVMDAAVDSLAIPFEDDTELEKGWGTSDGMFTVNWFVTNGFTIQ